MMRKFFLCLVISLLGLIGFGSCFDYIVSGTTGFTFSQNQNYRIVLGNSTDYKYYFSDYGLWCNQTTDFTDTISVYTSSGEFISWLTPSLCIVGGGNGVYLYENAENTERNFYMRYINIPFEKFSGCPSCPSTGEILSGYILESDIDINYCVENSLCPLESTGFEWSALFINDVQHEGAGIINITIPEEIYWDYSLNENEFDLDIEGYNVDTDYIEGIINTQNSKPNQVDLNNIVSGVLPLFVPGLFIILFIYFVFRFVKKVF